MAYHHHFDDFERPASMQDKRTPEEIAKARREADIFHEDHSQGTQQKPATTRRRIGPTYG